MATDYPYVGVSYSPQIDSNSIWYEYLNSNYTSQVGLPANITSLGSSISSRSYAFTTRRGRTYELGALESSECALRVNNSDGVFDPNNSSGSFYPNVLPYRPVSIKAAYPRTGNIFNDSNRADVPDVGAPESTARLSVTSNDSNFELNSVGNWYGAGGTAPSVTSADSHSGSYSLLVSGGQVAINVPVVAGQSICVSLWIKSASAGSAGSLSLFDGLWTTASAAATTSLPNNTTSWARYSATITPNTHRIAIYVSAGSGGGYIDDVQVEFGSTPTTNVVTGPTLYGLFNGFVERYPQSYQAPNRGEVNMVATDSFASMSQVALENLYLAYLIQDPNVALYYYPFSDGAESIWASNSGLYPKDPLKPSTFNLTSSAITFADASAQDLIPGAGTTNAVFNCSQGLGAVVASGTYLQQTNVEDLILSNGVPYTISFWTAPASGSAATRLFSFNDSLPSNDPRCFGIGISGGNKFQVFHSLGVTSTSVASYVANSWHHISLQMTWDGSVINTALSVNGVTVTGSFACASQLALTNFMIGGNGGMAHLSIHRGATTVADYYAIGKYAQLSNTAVGEQTGTRFSNLINTFSGFKYLPYSADLGASSMQPMTYSGSTLTDAIAVTSQTENGDWYVDGDGYVVFKDRRKRLAKLSPSVIFGDASGEVPYAGGDLVINYDPTYVYNNIQVDTPNYSSVSVFDDQSVARYYPRSLTKTIYNQTSTETLDAAYYLLSRYKDPQARPESLTLTPMRTPTMWASVLGLEIGDYVRVNKRPLDAPAISIDCFVERIEHSFDAQSFDWIVKLTLSPRIVGYWNLGSAQATSDATSTAAAMKLQTASWSGLSSVRDLIPGQLLQFTTAGGTSVICCIVNTPALSGALAAIDVMQVGTFTSSANNVKAATLSAALNYDQIGSVALSNSSLNGLGSGYFWIDGEIVAATCAGSTLTITARGAAQSKQSSDGTSAVSGSGSFSHLIGAPVYALTNSTTNSAGLLVKEILPNQLSTIPYQSWDSINSLSTLTAASTLGSWTGSLSSTGVGITTPASGIKYNSIGMNSLIDKDNFPSSDLMTGQILTLINSAGSKESVAVASVGIPDPTSLWSFSAYKISQAGTLNADLSIDGTTVTAAAAITASAILVSGELMQVTAGSGTTSLTVTRGTPDASVWGVLTKAAHFKGDTIYAIDNNAAVNTYSLYNAVIEGYNVSTAIYGSTRLAY